ncbi:unnamed protein product, partial [Urochloa humidicola]
MQTNFGVPSSTSKKHQTRQSVQLFRSVMGFKMTIMMYNSRTNQFSLVEYRAPTPAVGTPKPRNDAGDDDDEPPLNEDDDDELDDLEQGEDEPNTQNLVLTQFDK